MITNLAENKRFLSSAVFVLLLVLLLLYLTFIPVPSDNKDLIVTILGVLVGGSAAAMPNLFGDPDTEKAVLEERINKLEVENKLLITRIDTIKTEYDRLTDMLIKRHIVEADGITGPKQL